MYRGEANVSKPMARIIRTAGLFVPAGLFLYGILVYLGKVNDDYFIGAPFFYSVMALWTVVAVAQYLFPVKRQQGAATYLAAYHLLSAAYIIGVSGFTTPFSPAWVILFLASYAYFSKPGFYVSLSLLLATAIVNTFFSFTSNSVLITDIITLVSVAAVGFVAIAIGRTQEVDEAEFTRTKVQEVLQRDRMITLVNNLADAILSTDKNGIVRVYNAASLNLLDTNASLNGQAIDEILSLHTKDGAVFTLADELQATKGVVIRDDLLLRIDDEEIRVELTYSPIRNSFSDTSHAHSSDSDGYILILRDITKAKSLEEERDEFISVVSHELRTPITIVEGTISNVQVMMGRPDISEHILKESIATAHDQVIYLAKMVNDLSTLSRAERGVADAPEDITVQDLVDDLYKEYAPQAEAKKLHFNLDLDTHLGHVTASPLYLKELLQNFITNALKYTKDGSIVLRVTREKNQLRFEVRDTGIGISKSDQAKIFNKFYRSEDYRTRETSGTGLGLYVASKLAKKLETKIDFHSRLNHGSSFGFALALTTTKKPNK